MTSKTRRDVTTTPDYPFSVYSTWGYHDELGDRVRLTEDMVMRALDTLERWRTDHGVRQDFFHIDCFWFDPAKGFMEFHPETWPAGFGRALARIRAAGMTPGLWYSTNGLHMDTPEWQDSRDETGCCYSLAEGPYAEGLKRAVLHAARNWQVRLFKFDFANFHARAKGSRLGADENYRISQGNFLGILHELRNAFPDVVIITHCGFARKPVAEFAGARQRYGPDKTLLREVDAVFSGDPHAFNIPQSALTRNMDLFQDRNVWKMAQEGFPLDRIEDHGVITATTNTAHYRGRSGFRRTHIGQLARGGRRDFFYGDPSLLTADDLQGMRGARKLFFDAFSRGLTTSFVGTGEPGLAPWHGYLTGEGHSGLLYVVNPGTDPITAQIPLINIQTAKVLFHDGGIAPPVQTQADVLRIHLGPEQMALVGLGDYAVDTWTLGSDNDPPLPEAYRLLPVALRRDNGSISGQIKGLARGIQVMVVAEALDADENSPHGEVPFVFARQDTKACADMTPKAHELLNITVEITDPQGGTRLLAPVAQIPDVPIWSGISWVSRTFLAEGDDMTITVTQRFEKRRRILVRAYAVYGLSVAVHSAPTARHDNSLQGIIH